MASRRPPPPVPSKGNDHAVVHGAHAEPAPAALNAKMTVIYDALVAAAPVRGADGDVHPADRFAVAMLARVLCRLDAASEYVDQHGQWDRRGRVRSVARHELRLASKAEKLMDKLGMTPTARAKLGLDLMRTADLATAMSEPDADKRAAMLRQLGAGGQDLG